MLVPHVISLALVRHDGEALTALIIEELEKAVELVRYGQDKETGDATSFGIELVFASGVEPASSSCVELASSSPSCVETCADGTFLASSLLMALAAKESS